MRFFTADLHLGHANILSYCKRPFPTVEAMNEAILTRWRETVSPHDEVWVLGDVALSEHWRDHLAELARLPGRKVLLPGNHDRCWPHHRKHRHKLAHFESIYREVFEAILPDSFETKVGGYDVLLAHFPYPHPIPGEDPSRLSRGPEDRGLPLLCGHSHRPRPRNGRMIDVGVDAWNFTPVPESHLETLLSDIVHGRRSPCPKRASPRSRAPRATSTTTEPLPVQEVLSLLPKDPDRRGPR